MSEWYVFWRHSNTESTSAAGRVLTINPIAALEGPFTKDVAVNRAMELKEQKTDKVVLIEAIGVEAIK